MKRTDLEKGITLIALIITIVVLLILAVVTINAIQGDGILAKAKQASEKYQTAQDTEVENLEQYEYEMAKINGETDAATLVEYLLEKNYGLKLGDYINYNVENYDGTWRVLGIENGQVLIVSESLKNLYLRGKREGFGYYEALEKLKERCKPYGSGEWATNSRSIMAEDINKITGFDPAKVSLLGDKPYGYGKDHEYGTTGTYWIGDNGKINFKNSNGLTSDGTSNTYSTFHKLSGGTLGDTANDKVEEVNNYFHYYFQSEKESYKDASGKVYMYVNSVIKNLISGAYWLANEGIYTNSVKGCSYGLMNVNGSFIDRRILWHCGGTWYQPTNTTGVEREHNLAVRAVVYLEKDIELTKGTTNGDGTVNWLLPQ